MPILTTPIRHAPHVWLDAGVPEARESYRALPPIETWPSVDEGALSDTARAVFIARRTAVSLYMRGVAGKEIARDTGIRRNALYGLLRRVGSPHPDGRIWGFRALIPWTRLAPRATRPILIDHPVIQAGPHAFDKLLATYPSLDQLIRSYVLKLRGAGRVQEPRIRLDSLQKRFLTECRELGLAAAQSYPFNTKALGYVSLGKHVRKLLTESTPRAIYINHGEAGLKKRKAGDGSGRPVEYPYERVECDAHHIDAMFCILVPTPQGEVLPVVVPRLWVLVIQDVHSRVVLGYYLSLNKECNEGDLIKAIQAALSPWQPTDLGATNLRYRNTAGFPSVLGEHFTGVCWKEFSVDGAKINFSARVQSKLDQFVNAKVKLLNRRIPDDRPFVERLFRTLEEGGFHRLPNTTGNSPNDIRRQSPEIAACKYFIQLEDLQRILDVLIANYNGDPHSTLGGRTPLEFLAWSVGRTQHLMPLQHIDPLNLKRLGAIRAVVQVRGGKGRRPYVHFQNARYTCPGFAQVDHLIGKRLTIECDPDDARAVFSYLPNGEEFGPLTAAPPWDKVPHSLLVRKLVAARVRNRRWSMTEMDDPVFSLLTDLEQRVRAKKAVSSEYLQLRQLFLDRKEEFLALAEDAQQLASNPDLEADPERDPPIAGRRKARSDEGQEGRERLPAPRMTRSGDGS